MTDSYEELIASVNENMKRQLANQETFQCPKCEWHPVNARAIVKQLEGRADDDDPTCPNFSFGLACMIRYVASLPQEGTCEHFKEVSQ